MSIAINHVIKTANKISKLLYCSLKNMLLHGIEASGDTKKCQNFNSFLEEEKQIFWEHKAFAKLI